MGVKRDMTVENEQNNILSLSFKPTVELAMHFSIQSMDVIKHAN